jgi:hypothetical protein
MDEMNIPGVAAKHAIITDECRQNRGDAGAVEEALRRLREEYDNVARGWPVGSGGRFHLVLVVERPAPIDPTLGGNRPAYVEPESGNLILKPQK